MIESHLGEIFALGTAVSWTATALAFQQATRNAGSLTVNVLRLIIAFIFFGIISLKIRGEFIPTDASAHTWVWLSISGVIGFIFGDYCLLKSFVYVSARVSMLIMSISPLFAALISWVILGETMAILALLAMAITLCGITLVVMKKEKNDNERSGGVNGLKFSFPVKGLLYALGGAVGQAVGLVLSKYGMGEYDAFAATHIRVIAGGIGLFLVVLFTKRWRRVLQSLFQKKTMIYIGIGSFCGPFIGVYLSLLSIKYTTIGAASTIMAIMPIMIIPPAIILYKEKVTFREIIGAFIAVGGVMLFFVK